MLLLPILLMSAALFSSFSLLSYKANHLAYALNRHESYVKAKYEHISLENKTILYRTFDPEFDY